MTQQLDLFTWKAAAVVAPFPPARRDRLVRDTAWRMLTDPEAAQWWKEELVGSIADPLLAAGVTIEEVRRQISWFRDAVEAEMARLDHGPDGGPGQAVAA